VNCHLEWSKLFYSLLVTESLELLISSLDQAPFNVRNVPTLFYLAETVLYTVRTRTSRRHCLTMSDSHMLTVGRLAFGRIYFHHLADQLVDFDNLRSHLFDYLDGQSSVYSLVNC